MIGITPHSVEFLWLVSICIRLVLAGSSQGQVQIYNMPRLRYLLTHPLQVLNMDDLTEKQERIKHVRERQKEKEVIEMDDLLFDVLFNSVTVISR